MYALTAVNYEPFLPLIMWHEHWHMKIVRKKGQFHIFVSSIYGIHLHALYISEHAGTVLLKNNSIILNM